MKVILKKDIAKVGKKYEIKTIADGHALNLLIPQGLVEVATKSSIAKMEKAKIADQQLRKVREDILAKDIKSVDGIRIEIYEKTNDIGHLFAGIHQQEIANEIKKQTGLDMEADFVKLEKPIKMVGEYDITVQAHDKKAIFKLVITATK